MNKADRQLCILALIYAVQDREGFAESAGRGPSNPAGEESWQLAQKFRALHKGLTGHQYLTPFEQDVAEATTISAWDLAKQSGD